MLETHDEISHEELNSLTHAIKTRYGIDFTNYEPNSLKRGFARLILKNNLDSLIDLWSKILTDRKFFMECIDYLTVNLTELFRNPDFWSKLHDVLDRFNTKSKLNIWHAGCSTGEEVYSMAFLLEEKNMLHKTSTWATDLSTSAISKASAGKYNISLKKKYEAGLINYLPHKSIVDLFTVNEEEMTVKSKYKHHIKFEKHNLVHDPISKKFDIIFCRNVMIYFDDFLKLKIIKLLHKHLNDDGLLIVGYYDMLIHESKQYFELYNSKTKIYKKVS